MPAEERKVLAGTLVGTSIEWYDFFIYAQAAGLVLAPLFLAPVAEASPALAQVLAFATIGISFLFRPLGAIVAGYLGDRLGRKRMLVFTLVLMGLSTSLIGLLPTYAAIGIAAPILLILLRILQGFSAGGEWGGAALMAVEHAPTARRGFFGAFPQIGVPVGMILATSTLFVITSLLSPEQFLAWGWRIPFLLSIVLIGVGYVIRRAVEESPVFQDLQRRKKESSAPLRQLFRHNTKNVMLTAIIFIGNNAAGYLLIAFFATYAVTVLGMDRPTVLLATTLASFGWLVFTLLGRPRLRPARTRAHVPDRLRVPRAVGRADVVPHRHRRHRLVLRRPVRDDVRPRPLVRPAGVALRRDVPGERALLGRLDRLRARRDPRRRVRPDDRRGADRPPPASRGRSASTSPWPRSSRSPASRWSRRRRASTCTRRSRARAWGPRVRGRMPRHPPLLASRGVSPGRGPRRTHRVASGVWLPIATAPSTSTSRPSRRLDASRSRRCAPSCARPPPSSPRS